ncbi:MAG: alanine--tRNA ligase [Sulfurovum sp.]|nr:alanine--tRNA ligase [Sulfurovum sp.]MCB4764747.1 alanine--tRNA ligase [Sulfurovum sp.]MCB4782204.1 alanine--tRNA ligase [Sulfurovum sp.]
MDIRKTFLDYFESKGHQVVESSPLVPDDPTLLFVNAGMVQFKNIFTGEAPIPDFPRATSSQTCIRAGGKHNDLDNVGYTARHHTFFEMLGNFSFGNYFKKEAIAYAWEFITGKEYLALPIEKIWVTVHDSDDEAYEIWKEHIAKEHIVRFGNKDNFWQMGDTGPCGPCSEIFYDQGEEHFSSPEDVMGGEGDRFLEIWNLVFMQYERDEKGKLHPLPRPSIDTGMGLERVVAIKEGVTNNYHSSLFKPLLDAIGDLIGEPYNYELSNSASYRVIADHLRSVSFLLAQGINFDKEGRGYVLRRVMRRAIRHGYLLGLRKPFMYKLVDTLIEVIGGHYAYLKTKKEAIETSMKLEEEHFFDTIEAGIKLFNQELKKTTNTFSGEVAFKLYDTFGFPLDLTKDMLREKGIMLDINTFNAKMEAQKLQSKVNWKGTGDVATIGDFKQIKEKFGVNEFVGYEKTAIATKILVLLDKNFKQVNTLDGKGWVMLEQTPFYAESGGQVGDHGVINVVNSNEQVAVKDTKKFLDINFSEVEGKLSVEDEVLATIDQSRVEVEKHHSATHLLHAALRVVLGDHISQAGSFNDDKRLRFDFSHPKAVTVEELQKVEDWVNSKIQCAIPRKTEIMNIDEAKNSNALALFGEKYGEKVRVVSMGDTSIELCGGTHVNNTSHIGLFMITKESGVSAGVRRIEAICGYAAIQKVKELRVEIAEIKKAVKNQQPIIGISKLKEEIKTLKGELKAALSSSKKALIPVELNGINTIVDEVETGDIKEMIDEAKNKYDNIAIMLFQKKGEKVLLAAGSKETSVKAGDWIKSIAPVVGGGGGGRSDFAQAGGKKPENITKAIKEAKTYLAELLESGNE